MRGLHIGGLAAGIVLLALFGVVASADQRRGDALPPAGVTIVQERSAEDPPPAGAPLVIERFEALQREGVFAGLNVTMINRSDAEQTGSVWYLLSPPYDTEEAWRTATYTAPHQSFTLAAGERRTFRFREPDLSVIGLFRVSVWSHVIDANGASIHADAMGHSTPIVAEPESGFGATLLEQWEAQRERTPVTPLPLEGDAQIVLVELERSTRFLRGVNVSVANTGAETREVYLSYGLDPAEHPEPWSQPTFLSPENRVTIEPGQTLPVTFSVPEALPAGDYRMALWMRRSPVDPPIVAAEHRFQIDPLFTFALPDESGEIPLVLSMSASPRADDSDGYQVTFAVRNDSSLDRLIGIFYSVVPSDSLAPWRAAFDSMPLRFLNLKQKENYIFTDERQIHVPPGEYQVIGWVVELVEGKAVLRAAYSREMRLVSR